MQQHDLRGKLPHRPVLNANRQFKGLTSIFSLATAKMGLWLQTTSDLSQV